MPPIPEQHLTTIQTIGLHLLTFANRYQHRNSTDAAAELALYLSNLADKLARLSRKIDPKTPKEN